MVFVYTQFHANRDREQGGFFERGANTVPRDVVRVVVDPSVTSIPVGAFAERNNLAEVELSEGVVEIGDESFRGSSNSITKINIPTSLRRINDSAFARSLRCPIRLHDGIESIGQGAFNFCVFTNFRFPPLITVISQILHTCQSMFSLEIPVNVTEVKGFAFYNCYCPSSAMKSLVHKVQPDSSVDKVQPNGPIFISCLDR